VVEVYAAHTKVALGVKPSDIVPLRVSSQLQLLVIRGNIWVAIIVDWASRKYCVRLTFQFQYADSKYSRKLSVMLKFIFQLSQVGDNALALIGLLVIVHAYNRTVEVINGTSL
jgi:hypothetical protein